MSALRLPVSGLCPVDSAEKGKPDVLVVKPRWRPGRTPLVSERRRCQPTAGQRVTPDRFSPTTPARISPIDTSFSADTDSPRARMPTAAAPAAPMPVHSAYAGPTSSRPTATLSSPKLISAHAAKPTVGHSLVKWALCFSSTANAVSNRPAITIRTHAMGSPPQQLSAMPTGLPMREGSIEALGNRDEYSPRCGSRFDELVGCRDLSERHDLCDRDPECRLRCGIGEIARRGVLRILWEVVAAEQADRHICEQHGPERKLRPVLRASVSGQDRAVTDNRGV